MKSFPTIILVIFGFFIIAGVIAVASYGKFGSSGSGDVPAQAVLWGTLDKNMIDKAVQLFNEKNDNILTITYTQFSEEAFDAKLTEALAENRGPDAIILSQERLLKHEKKIYPIPFQNLPERTFRDTFIEGAELFVGTDGILAFPLAVDPMVLYWNRTLFNAAGIAQPPLLWEEITALVPKLTKSDTAHNVLQSAIALGEYRNVNHAKEILALMMMQAGNPITIRTENGVMSSISERFGLSEVPADSALRFYTEFANPVKPSYSWNRSLIASKDLFVRGDLAMYLGFSGELFGIREQNPNLNFDVTRMPQVRDAVQKSTFGTIYAIAILNQSPTKANAFQAATILTSKEMSPFFLDILGLPPARRDALSQVPTDPYKAVFYNDALISRGFYDPDPVQTNALFSTLIEDVTSGRVSISQAVSQANGRMSQLLE
ncbi:MAG: extracellular solute-binding protein [Candidatus Campbellbacteria bacterium]|nr:extracellular solute-binding protein [Candidatus Campbellbacteria bacterium]